MTRKRRLLSVVAATAFVAATLAAPAAAQDQPKQDQNAAAQPAPSTPSPDQSKAPTPAPNTDPNLQVATVRLEGGYRASKVIGAAVYNSQNQQIGTVDDIILNHQNQADLVVISVGGFLGVGGKLVALPYGKIERTDTAKVMLPDGDKDTLAKMPSFTYAQ